MVSIPSTFSICPELGIRRKDTAIDQAKRTLAELDRLTDLGDEVRDAPHWQRSMCSAWSGSAPRGRTPAKLPRRNRAKRDLLRWRLHTLLAELTGDMTHFHKSALMRPDLPSNPLHGH